MITSPLAQRIRPMSLNEMVGQPHILGKNGLLSKIEKSAQTPNMIFYGPPGTGKTTAAEIIASKCGKKFYKLNATTASLSDIKNIISQLNPIIAPNGALLYLDEIQYFNKKQQQSLLEFLENGKLTMIASTTENPYFYIYNAILSRCQVFEFKKIENEEIKKALKRGVKFLEQEENIKIKISNEAFEKIANISNGDVRKSLNILEICSNTTNLKNGTKNITYDSVLKLLEENSFGTYNKTGDDHYDLLSAFQKSLRGSDPDAAIYYLAKLLQAGEIISVCRRLSVCACEDVGLAYPQLIPIVKSCIDIAMQVGMPEARIPLADAVIEVAIAPKSNSAYQAINNAMDDLKNGKNYPVPRHLQNIHCDSTENENIPSYIYPHEYKNHWVKQQYLPNEIKNKKYYYAQPNKNESAFDEYWKKIKK